MNKTTPFDAVAELYDRSRPDYPGDLVEDLLSLSAIGPASRVLEIGSGTGQISTALASRAGSLLAIELGPNLAAATGRRLAPFANARVVVADFDSWAGPAGTFDAVVAATSFHWLDPSARISRCAALLRPGGTLAVVETRWGVAVGEDPFFAASQACYVRWTPDYDPARRQVRPEDVVPISLSAPDSTLVPVAHRRLVVPREYTSAEYRDLLSTFSDVLALEPGARAHFLACIVGLIDSQFGGRVSRQDLYDLSVARRIVNRG